MLEELRKRPLMRPLLVWIAGIILQSYFSCADYIIWLLAPVFILCLPLKRKRPGCVSYEARWKWGAMFGLLLLFLSVCRTASIEESPLPEHLFPVIGEKAEEVQRHLLSSLDSLDLEVTERSVLSTITLGYRKDMDWQTRRKFSTTGVAHILSVSGFHVAVVCGCLASLFYFLPRYRWAEWLRFVLMSVLLWCFVFLAGLSASAVRAGLMLSLYFTGRVLEKRTDRYNIWAASAFLMLVYNPHYLFDIGFELSYIAVFFLFWLQPDLKQLIKVRNPLLAEPWGWITVTLAAQIGVMFLCIYYFRQFSTVFLLSAVPVTFLSTLLIPLALLWMLLPSGWGAFCGLDRIVEWLTHTMFRFVDLLGAFPQAAVPVSMNVVELLAAYAALAFFILALKKRYARYLLYASGFLIVETMF